MNRCRIGLLAGLAAIAAEGFAAADFDIVRDGKPAVAIEVPAYPQGTGDVAFFTNAVFRCTGAEMEVKSDELRVKSSRGQIVFRVETRPIVEEDDWAIDFPDGKTLRITGTAMSCRWALNWILEERFGCCFCFPGLHGSHYPRAKSVSLPREARKGTMSLKLQRDLYREDPAWQRAMGGKAPAGNFMGHNLKSFLPIAKYAKDPWREKIMPEINGVRIVPKYPGKAWNNCYASEESVTESVKNICAHLRAHPEEKVYALSVNDNSGHCECAGCRELNGGSLKEPCRYGSPGHKSISRAYYTWVNRVAAGVAAEFPDVLLGLLAYRGTIDPPDFRLHPNVVPFLCVDVSQLVEPNRIANRRELFGKWSACVRNFGLWDYAYGFRYTPARVYLRTMDSFFKWQREFPAFGGVFAEGDTYMGEGPKRWWHYKLMADAGADREAALGRWYAACCGTAAAPHLKAYYDLLESYWTGNEIRKTDWFRNTNCNTYLNFSECTYLFALPKDLMARAGALMREVVAAAEKTGDADQRWRAARLLEYHEMYAARCVWSGACHSLPDGRFADREAAAGYVRALPEMCAACNEAIRLADRLEESRRVELGRPLPLIDPSAKRPHTGWGVSVLFNPNFPYSMNEALRYLGEKEFAAALAAASADKRLYPDFAETLRSLGDLASAPDCAYAEIRTDADDLASWTRKSKSAARTVALLGGRRYRLTNASGEDFGVVKSIGGLEKGYYLYRVQARNESPDPVVVSTTYHSASPNWGDTDPVGLRANARVKPGETRTLQVFCREKECQASLGCLVKGLAQGQGVVLENVEFLRLAKMARGEDLAEAANPGRLDAARKASKSALNRRQEENKVRMWMKKTGISVEAFNAMSPGEQGLVKQAFSCKMSYADYKALKPAARRAKLEEAKARRAAPAKAYPVRGVYFATHFGNWYEKASDRELADYIAELKHWGCNSITTWFDMHDYAGMDDPRVAVRLNRIRRIFEICNANGIRKNLLVLANEAFKTSPESLRADWKGRKNGYRGAIVGHYHVEVCPSKPGGMDYILKARKAVLDAFADVKPDSVMICPYDQGGCTCDGCAPWGANGFLRVSKELSALARKTFPDVRVILSTWRFDAFGSSLGEWEGLGARREDVRTWADGLFVDQEHLDRLDADPILPYFPMTEISMDRMLPWGGFGANPCPTLVEEIIRRHPKIEGTMPYSEGIYEDLNKVVGLALLSGTASSAQEAVELYAKRYFGERECKAVAEAVFLLERNMGHNALAEQDGQTRDFYSFAKIDVSRPWALKAKLARLDAERAEKAAVLLKRAEDSMADAAKASWRWRILMLRAEIDRALAKGAGLDALQSRFDELAELYHVDRETLPWVMPPSRKHLRLRLDLSGHGAL